MFVTLSDSKGSDVRSFDEANEETFYELLAENLSKDTVVVLNLVNERCDVNIEIEFKLDGKKTDTDVPEETTVAWKKEADGYLEFLDEEDIPDWS